MEIASRDFSARAAVHENVPASTSTLSATPLRRNTWRTRLDGFTRGRALDLFRRTLVARSMINSSATPLEVGGAKLAASRWDTLRVQPFGWLSLLEDEREPGLRQVQVDEVNGAQLIPRSSGRSTKPVQEKAI